MTSVVSKEDLADELYKLGGPHRQKEISRLLVMIDRYSINLARTLPRGEDDAALRLKPGDTDVSAGTRRCAGCGKVKDLERGFAKYVRDPYGRNKRCIDCRPPANWTSDRRQPHLYLCRACGQRKPLDEFPPKKREHPSVLYHCLACIPQ